MSKGEIWFFEYHCDESPESSDYKLFQHTLQKCEIVRELEDKKEVDVAEVGRMFEVVFDDGLKWSVFEDELLYKIKAMESK